MERNPYGFMCLTCGLREFISVPFTADVFNYDDLERITAANSWACLCRDDRQKNQIVISAHEQDGRT